MPEREVMNAREAADFLRLSENAFGKLAPSLPRAKLYDRAGYRYLRSDLLLWLRERKEPDGLADSLPDSNPRAIGGNGGRKYGACQKVTRLV